VPFLSDGMTSLIINLAAFGIVLSLSRERASENQKRDIVKYDKVIVAGAVAYIGVSLVLLGTLVWYQAIDRDRYLTKYAAVTNTQGARVVEYNPRINLLMKKLYAGNIYDRSGLLLATNEKELLQNEPAKYVRAGIDENAIKTELKKRKQRYYPFGDNLFFMLGDFNSKILWNNSDENPYGYMAESRHLAALRGFDNTKDNRGNLLKPDTLYAHNYRPNSFLKAKEDTAFIYHVYNYSAIVPMLRAGLNSREVEKWNGKRENRDIMLTVDAALQTKMQNELDNYAKNNFKGQFWNKLRVSVVVLNAKNGDLLCSANYPSPNQDTLRNAPHVYSERDKYRLAYTDRDLGLTFQTAPGSTAKVMSALAGLQKNIDLANKKYYIDSKEIIEKGQYNEPNNENVTMEDAIVKSSNCYFVNLVNDNDLYTQLDSIYQTVGIRIDREGIDNKGKTFVEKVLVPYFFNYGISGQERSDYDAEVAAMGNKGVTRYKNYVAKRDANKGNPAMYHKMNWNECAWAWGQGTMRATPLNMARVAAIVANGGTFVETQFIKKGNEILETPSPQTIPIVSPQVANILKTYMQNESSKHRSKGYSLPELMGGKTGTPERDLYYAVYNEQTKRTEEIADELPERETIIEKNRRNDGWYIFFIHSEKEKAPLAVALRMERLGAGISGNAVRLADKVVINKALRESGYVK
jgi:cell division protein FtsI/penicillin-binding protein 2